MKTIALISCVKKKNDFKCMAKDMYISDLFTKQYLYAKKKEVDEIYILSARYGLLKETDVIEPYNETLIGKPVMERRKWAEKVYSELNKVSDPQNDTYLILAGSKYYEFLEKKLPHCILPLKGMKIGERLRFLKKEIE